MRIGIDVRAVQNDSRYRGIGKFTHSLLLALADGLRADEQVVIYAEDAPLPPDLVTGLDPVRVVRVPSNRAAEVRFVRAFAPPMRTIAPRVDEVDVFLQPDAAGGIGSRVPAVAIVYDLIPLLFRALDPPGMAGTLLVRHRIMQALAGLHYRAIVAGFAQAGALVAISESSRADYLRFVERVPRRPVRVGLGALVAANAVGRSDAALTRLGLRQSALPPQRYLLYVGGIDERKNIVQLLRDLDALLDRHRDLKLVVVGNEFSRTGYLEALRWTQFLREHPRVERALVVAGYVPEEELPSLYRHAQAFVFPSRYEGFGLPVLEAMDAGCPVICYRNSSLPEVAGDAALMLTDGEPMAAAIDRLLTEPGLADDLRARGHAQVSRYSWDAAAAAVLDAAREVAGQPNPGRRLAGARAFVRLLTNRSAKQL